MAVLLQKKLDPRDYTEMTADLADRIDDVLADLLGELGELSVVQRVQVGGAVDSVEQALCGF